MADRFLFYLIVFEHCGLCSRSALLLLGRQKRTAFKKALEQRRKRSLVTDRSSYLHNVTRNLEFQAR